MLVAGRYQTFISELPVRRSITALFNLCPPSLRALVAPSVWVKQLALVAHWNCSCCAQLVAYLTELPEKECIWSRPVPQVASATAQFCVALPKCRIPFLDCALLPKHGHAFPEYVTYGHKDCFRVMVLTNDYFIITVYREQHCLTVISCTLSVTLGWQPPSSRRRH